MQTRRLLLSLAIILISITSYSQIGGEWETETGAIDGWLKAYPTSVNSPYSYIWTTGATTDSISGLSIGDYSVTITDNLGINEIHKRFIGTIKNRIWVEFEALSISSSGLSDGSIDISCSGGVTPYTYLWSTGSTSEDLNNLDEGLYQVWVTDNTGITDSCFISVGSDQLLDWTWINTGNNHTILVLDTIPKTINGIPVESGDLIGVFYEDGGTMVCGGYCVYNGVTNAVAVWGDDLTSGSPQKDGFSLSESINFYVRDVSANRDYNVSTLYFQFPQAFSNYNHYYINGISGLSNIGPSPTTSLFYDIAVNEIVFPQTHCDFDAITNITVELSNEGNIPVAGFLISYNISNYFSVTEIVSNTIQPGDTIQYSFATQVYLLDTTLIPDVFITSYTSHPGDLNNSNDTVVTYLANLQPSFTIFNDTASNCLGFINVDSIIYNPLYPPTYYWDNPIYGSDLLIDSLCSGVYTFIIDDGICIDSFPIEISNINTTIDITITQPSCNATWDGIIEANLLYPSGVVTYLWSTAATTNTISGLSPGIYSVTVYENGTAFDSEIVNLINPTPISYSALWQNESFPGTSDGFIVGSTSGGTPPYTFLWSNGATTESIMNIGEGIYTQTITDANGCLGGDSFTIGVTNSNLSFSYITDDVNCNGGSDGSAYITNVQGVPPFTYLWSNGETSDSISNLSALIYYITVTDAVGNINSQGIQIYEPSIITITSTITDATQTTSNDGSININVSGGTMGSGYAYLWSNNQTTQNINNLSIGSYIVTVIDSNGCTSTEIFVINAINPNPISLSSIITNNNCFGDINGELAISISGGTPPYSYLWSNGETTQNITNLSAGTYTVEVWGAGATQSTTPWPWDYTITAANATILIQSGTVTLNGVAPPIGSYIGVFYDDNGVLACGGYIEYLNTSNALTAWADDNSTTSIKEGFETGEIFTFQIYANGNSHFLQADFSPSFPNTGNFSVNGVSGILTLQGSTNNSVTETFTITEPSQISVTASVTNINPAVSIYGSIDITPTGGTPPYSFLWSNGATTEDLLSVTIGNYIITITDANQCSFLDTFFLTYTTLPDWNFTYSGNSHSIEIPATTLLQIYGAPISNGDFIGVFYDSLGVQACAGYTIWMGTNETLWAYGDNLSTTEPDGFTVAEEFSWIVWEASTNTEYPAAASYNSSYPNQQFWQINGESGLDSLQAISITGTITTTTKSNLQLGMVVLYEPNQGSYYAVNKGLVIDGEYKIDGLLPGEYLIYAIPAPGNDYGIPGYFVQNNNWNNATLINVTGYTGGVDIIIDPVIPYNTGNGAISGNIYVGSDNSYNPDVFGDEWFPGSTKDDETPARNIPILLFDDQMNAMDFRLSNDLGAFEFEQLELGTYFVRVEKAGLQADEIEITLTAENPISDGMAFSLETGYVSIHEMINISNFKIYPNPVKEELFVQLENIHSSDIQLKMYNITGQEINISELLSGNNTQEIIIDMKSFNPGIYLLEISNNSQKQVYKVNKI